MIRKRQAAFSDGNTTLSRHWSNKIKREIKDAKRVYYSERSQHLKKSDPAGWYRGIRTMTTGKRQSISIRIPDVDSDDHVTISNRINGHFVSIASDIPPLDRTKLPSYLPARLCPLLEPWEVFKELKAVNPSKACGPDRISGRLIKEFALELCVPLTKIINSSYQSGRVPLCNGSELLLCQFRSQNQLPLRRSSQFHLRTSSPK